MDDGQVVDAFLNGSNEPHGGENLHIEEDVLVLAGCWEAVLRLDDDTYAVRTDPLYRPSPELEAVPDRLAQRGWSAVGDGEPLIHAITYAELALMHAQWSVWSVDAATAEAALAARVNKESADPGTTDGSDAFPTDLVAQFERARRIVNVQPPLILTVGIDPPKVEALRAAMPEALFETATLEELDPEACGSKQPGLMIVQATERTGREFVLRLRAVACGRFLPVAAVTTETEPPLGADVALDADALPGLWRRQLVPLL